MSRFTYEGRVKLTWVPDDGIDNIAAPTVAEIESGTDFTVYMPTAGVGITHGQAMATLPMIDQRQVHSQPGSETAEVELTFVLDDEFAATDPYVFFSHGDAGFWVRSLAGYTGADDAPAADDPVAVYKATSGSPRPNQPAQDEFAQCVVPFGVGPWNVQARVAAAA